VGEGDCGGSAGEGLIFSQSEARVICFCSHPPSHPPSLLLSSFLPSFLSNSPSQYLHRARYFDEATDCKKLGIVHRNLMPDNVLLNATSNVCKLTEFGAGVYQDDMTRTVVKAPLFTSPEIVRNDMYDEKADSYSYGMVLVALLRCERTFEDFFMNSLTKKMGKADRKGVGMTALYRNLDLGWRPKLPDEIYPKLANLIITCWDNDPLMRPDFEEIVNRLNYYLSKEVKDEDEPVYGSGHIIGENHQIEGEVVLSDTNLIGIKDHNFQLLNMEREKQEIIDEKSKMLEEMQETMRRQSEELSTLRAKSVRVELLEKAEGDGGYKSLRTGDIKQLHEWREDGE